MDKCLVTRLKGTADASLPFYDAIRMRIKWGSETSFAIKASGGLVNLFFGGEGVKLKVLSNGSVKVGDDNVGSEYTITVQSTSTIDILPVSSAQDTEFLLIGLSSISTWGRTTAAPYRLAYSDDLHYLQSSVVTSTSFALLAGDAEPCDLSVLASLPNKQAITVLLLNNAANSYKGDIAYLSELPSLQNIANYLASANSGVYGDISTFIGNTTIKRVELRRSDRIVGMVDSLSQCSALTHIDLQSTQVAGNLASLGACPNLTSIILASTSVTGTVENLVAAFNAAGRTSGSITIGFVRTGITYNGQSVTGTTLAWNGTNITIS